LKDENINSKQFIEKISQYKCDLFVSMSFNQIFKKEIINLTKYKIINCHAGKLPFYRGRNILNWALINGETEFGITVHYVDEGIDTGDIILQELHSISLTDDYSTLLKRSYTGCADILYKAVSLFKSGAVKGHKQSEIGPLGFYCTQRKLGDEIINWNDSAKNIFNFVRAICYPGPKARAFINGAEIMINRSEIVEEATSYTCTIGAVLSKDATGLLVKTKDSFIKITEYSPDAAIKVGGRFELR